MNGALWLATRELRVRWRRALLAALVVAAATAATTTLELLARARERAVAGVLDQVGAPLVVVPAGTTAAALERRELAPAPLPPEAARAVSQALGPWLRAAEPRLVFGAELAGRVRPIVGVAPEVWRALGLESGAAAGAELGRRLGPGSTVGVAGRTMAVNAVLPSTGDADDVALLLPLTTAQVLSGIPGINELRLYLEPGVDPSVAAQRLAPALDGLAVIRRHRGAVADGEAQGALAMRRAVALGVLGAVVLLVLLAGAHLDTAERRLELATLNALGAPRAALALAVATRSGLLAAAGAATGLVTGVGLAILTDPAAAGAAARAADLVVLTLAAASMAGLLAAAPAAIAGALRDPVPDLQEG